METSDIERDYWFRQEEDLIDVATLPVISDSRCTEQPIALLNLPTEVNRATIIDVASNLVTGYQLVHEPASVNFSLFYQHPEAQILLASFWSFRNAEAGNLERLPNVRQLSNCMQNFVHPTIHHLLGVQARNHMEVRDLVMYTEHQRKFHSALVRRLDHSFSEVQVYATQNRENQLQLMGRLNELLTQLNTRLPGIVHKILTQRGATQLWFQDVTRHILAMEVYTVEASTQQDQYTADINHHADCLNDTHDELHKLQSCVEDLCLSTQADLSRVESLATANSLSTQELKNEFLMYNDHIQQVLEENYKALQEEMGSKLAQLVQQPHTTEPLPAITELESIQKQLDSLAVSNNEAFKEV